MQVPTYTYVLQNIHIRQKYTCVKIVKLLVEFLFERRFVKTSDSMWESGRDPEKVVLNEG